MFVFIKINRLKVFFASSYLKYIIISILVSVTPNLRIVCVCVSIFLYSKLGLLSQYISIQTAINFLHILPKIVFNFTNCTLQKILNTCLLYIYNIFTQNNKIITKTHNKSNNSLPGSQFDEWGITSAVIIKNSQKTLLLLKCQFRYCIYYNIFILIGYFKAPDMGHKYF